MYTGILNKQQILQTGQFLVEVVGSNYIINLMAYHWFIM